MNRSKEVERLLLELVKKTSELRTKLEQPELRTEVSELRKEEEEIELEPKWRESEFNRIYNSYRHSLIQIADEINSIDRLIEGMF